MTSEHLTTPVSGVMTSTAATRRSSRLASDSRVPRTDYEKSCDEQETFKKKRRRESNIQRGQEALRIRLESEKKSAKSGEKVKTHEVCCKEANFLTANASKDLSRLKRKLVDDSAMNSPTETSEDEQEAEDRDGDANENEDRVNDAEFWNDFMESVDKQTARSNVSGARRRLGTEEERKAAAEKKRAYKVKGIFKTHDEYATAIADATKHISETEDGKKSSLAQDIVAKYFTDGSGNRKVTAKHLVNQANIAPGKKPRTQGSPHLLPEEEEAVAHYVQLLRAKGCHVSPEMVLSMLNDALEKSPDVNRQMLHAVLKAKNKSYEGLTKGMLSGFYRRHGLQTTHPEAIDVERLNWTTAAHANTHFDLIKDIACRPECGMAKMNENWDPKDENSYELEWIHPGRLFSCDETDLSLKQPLMKTKKETCVTDIEDKVAQTMHVKSSRKTSACFGRTGDNEMIAPFFVHGSLQRVPPKLRSDALHGHVKDANGNYIPTQYAANEKGSVDGDLFFNVYVKEIIVPTAFAKGVRNEDGKRGIFLFDGVQTHISEECLLYCRENGLHVIARPPNTSSDLQGEDTVFFRELKPEFRVQIARKLTELNSKDFNAPAIAITDNDWASITAATLKKIATPDIFERSWRRDGVIPFTRAPAKRLEEKEKKERLLRGEATTTTPSSLLQPQIIVKPGETPFPIAMPKRTDTARQGIARAVSTVQESNVSRESLETAFLQLRNTLKENFGVPGEALDEIETLAVKVIDERDGMSNAVQKYVTEHAPIARTSDLWNITGGLTSNAALARLRQGNEVSKKKEVLAAQKKSEREQKQAAKEAQVKEDLNKADADKENILNGIKRDGIEKWDLLSYRACLTLYKSKFRQKPGNKIALIPLRTMLKEAYKEDLDQLFPKQPTVTEADDETAEKEVNIIAEEVVSVAPPLAETGAALDAEPKSNL